jgi:2-polyprenyl-3-methyl-5-hydroxy-6-metoxy-1,4-benzoquinol methylase
MDLLGQAIYDHYFKLKGGKLWIHNKYGAKEEMPVNTYFRDPAKMPEMELLALQICKGKVLDIGAAAGSHALALQAKSTHVTALDISAKACEVMKLRGVERVVQEDIFAFKGKRFDTLLLLMNGIGVTGNIQTLKLFLQQAKKLVNANGQLLFDSSDVAYLYDGIIPEMTHYYGEIHYRYEYKKQKTDWFSWLYIDKVTLAKTAAGEGWKTEILLEDEFDQFLAKLTIA